MTTGDGAMECPFCGCTAGYTASGGDYAMLLHMETHHPEGPSPFLADEAAPSTEGGDKEYVDCPIDGCGETIPLDELAFHVDMHADEADTGCGAHRSSDVSSVAGEAAAPSPRQGQSPQPIVSTRQQSAIQSWRSLLAMPAFSKRQAAGATNSPTVPGAVQPKRLGRAQLGKYAHEDSMPDWLVTHLERGGQVDQPGVISVLGQLLSQSSSTKYAYLCHDCVHHISKLKKEGGFCGYRNIQMMVSYINGVQFPGHQRFKKIPSVFQIQDLIEAAWDAGINAQGRVETGGIRGTRKYIGTPEALAVLKLLEIPCDAQGFKDKEPGRSEALLMDAIENYFKAGTIDPTQKVRTTHLAPVYFQHAGHSMTIVGFEREKSGAKNILVFDPMFSDASAIVKLVGRKFEHRFPDMALRPYRRGNKYLRRYREFELLRLKPEAMLLLPDNDLGSA